MKWLDLILKPPPGPPQELVDAREQFKRDAHDATIAVRQYRESLARQRDVFGRLKSVNGMIRGVHQ